MQIRSIPYAVSRRRHGLFGQGEETSSGVVEWRRGAEYHRHGCAGSTPSLLVLLALCSAAIIPLGAAAPAVLRPPDRRGPTPSPLRWCSWVSSSPHIPLPICCGGEEAPGGDCFGCLCFLTAEGVFFLAQRSSDLDTWVASQRPISSNNPKWRRYYYLVLEGMEYVSYTFLDTSMVSKTQVIIG